MLNRLFGKKKDSGPTPTLDDASASIGNRMTEAEEKIKALDAELLKCKAQMAKLRPGPQLNSVKQRALQILKQKKVYEKHRDGMFAQQFNIDQTKFTQASLKDTATTMKAMKAASTELKASFKEIDIDEVEDLYDDMADMMQDHEEINEVMSRAYAVPDDINEEDLAAELDDLEQEMEGETLDVPDYLLNAATAKKDAERAREANTAAASTAPAAVQKDEFGLPVQRVTL